MTSVTETLKDVLARAESWPEADQAELVELAHEIEAPQASGYDATPDELERIDRGLRAAAEGRLASDEQVEAVFGKRGRAISRYSSLYNSTGPYRNPKDKITAVRCYAPCALQAVLAPFFVHILPFRFY
jgi:hypothetical protein